MGRVDRATGLETHPAADELRARAARMRALDLVSIHAAGSGHPGGTLSVMDIAAVLFLDEARYDPQDPRWEGRDRIFFSAGHKAPALYAALVERGYHGEEEAVSLRKLGSPFQGHPHAPALCGVEVSSGSLGQGLGIAVGVRPGGPDGRGRVARVLHHRRRGAPGGQHLGGRHGGRPLRPGHPVLHRGQEQAPDRRAW